ncbi:MAG: hypothetical protein WBO10_11660 [Pyrinomonadaceae bacterium]
MKAIIIGCALGLFTLFLSTSAPAQVNEVRTAGKTSTIQKDIPVTITDATGKPVKLESLPRRAQVRVEKMKAAARRLRGDDETPESIVVTIHCTWSPLRCTITVQF